MTTTDYIQLPGAKSTTPGYAAPTATPSPIVVNNGALRPPYSPASGSSAPATPSVAPKPVTSITSSQGQQTLQKTIAQATKLGATPPQSAAATASSTGAAAPSAPTSPAAPTKVVNGITYPVDTNGNITGAGKDAQGNFVAVSNNSSGGLSAAGQDTTGTKITLINPETEQTVTFQNPDLNKGTIQSYMSSGYQLSDASGAIPDWLTPSGTSGATTITGSSTPTGNPMLDQANADLASAKNDLNTAKSNLNNVMMGSANDPQLQSMLSAISSQWDTRIQQMQDAENSRIASLGTTGIRLGSQYTGDMFGGVISAEERAAATEISSLQAQKQSALASAQSAYESQKWTQYYDLVQTAQKAYDNQLSQVQKLQDAQATQDQAIQAKIVTATMQGNVMKLYNAGLTNPADILSALQSAGDQTTSLTDISSAINALVPTGVSDLVKTASANGAPANVIQSILKSGNLTDAYTAAGAYGNGGTGVVGEYNYYKAQSLASGQTPVDFNTYQDMNASRSARATAAATSALTPQDNPDAANASGAGNDILGATGLSYNAFLAITGQMSSLPRDSATRNAASAEVAAFAKRQGVDVSTLTSQLQAFNETLKNNIARQNNTKIAGEELSGTIEQFINDFNPKDANQSTFFGLGNNTISAQNIVDLMAGKQVNNKLATKYSFDIETMANDLASYYAASRTVTGGGAVPVPDDADKAAAARVIAAGINTGSAQSLKDSIDANVQKVSGVVQSAVDSSRQNVWNALGVGSDYKPQLTSTQIQQQESESKAKVTAFAKANPNDTQKITTAMDSLQKALGRKPTYSEFLQAYPEYGSSVKAQPSDIKVPNVDASTTAAASPSFNWSSLFNLGSLSTL